MPERKAVFIYPYTKESFREGGNNYIKNVLAQLSKKFIVVNKFTKIGLFDALFKFGKYDVLYFNWIEDIPERRFGALQIPVLFILLILAKVSNIKIIWFVHNNVSHSNKHFLLKKFIIRMMQVFSDQILSHSHELKIKVPKHKLKVFHHPIDANKPILTNGPYQYDVLIWGTVSPYKGISEFIEYNNNASEISKLRVLIAGKFTSEDYYERVLQLKRHNLTISNKIIPEDEIRQLFSDCRYILFTYNSPSILSSAALCKSLSYAKEVIGPNIGSFKELGDRGLIYNYDSFSSLGQLLNDLCTNKVKAIDKNLLLAYIQSTTWDHFGAFLTEVISAGEKK